MTHDTAEVRQIIRTLPIRTAFDEAAGYWVSRCAQTGHVTTADDETTANDMMKELLTDEVFYAVRYGTLDRLLYPDARKPAHS